MMVESIERPLFLAPNDSDYSEGCAYNRMIQPARMTGGSVLHAVEVSRDGGPFESFSPYREPDIRRLLNRR